MDPNSIQRFPGTAYVQKLQSEVQSEDPFAAYDALTPDEPGRVWQFVKRLPSVLGKTQAALREGMGSQRGMSAAHKSFAE